MYIRPGAKNLIFCCVDGPSEQKTLFVAVWIGHPSKKTYLLLCGWSNDPTVGPANRSAASSPRSPRRDRRQHRRNHHLPSSRRLRPVTSNGIPLDPMVYHRIRWYTIGSNGIPADPIWISIWISMKPILARNGKRVFYRRIPSCIRCV